MIVEKVIIWAEGKPSEAIEMLVHPLKAFDIEAAAVLLNCEVDQVNQCSFGEMDAYSVSLA